MNKKNHDHIENINERVGAAPGFIKQALFKGRRKKQLGDIVGISQFGVNHTTLEPGAQSALRHWHEAEDEFVFVLSGEIILIDDRGEHTLRTGSFCGFPGAVTDGHHLVNRSSEPASFIEIGSRLPGQDVAHYPDDDFGPIKR